MCDLGELVGRLALVVECSDDSWRGALVSVQSFWAETCSYEVTCGGESNQFLWSQLVLYTPVAFSSRFPNAPVEQGSHAMTEFPVGAVVDFANADAKIKKHSSCISVIGSCRVVGNQQCTARTNTIDNGLIINTVHEDDIVEFENVHWQPQPQSWWVHCLRGRIVFRSCSFDKCRRGVIVGKRPSDSVHVHFENCSFSDLRGCGIVVNGGSATVVNCTFEEMGMGISVRSSGHLYLQNSSFQSCIGGVVVPNQGCAIIEACSFKDLFDFCILASNGSKVNIDGCSMKSESGDGVVVEGGSNTSVVIRDSLWRHCKTAVRVGNGSTRTEISNSSAKYCTVGVYAAVDAIGYLDVSQSNDLRLVNVAGGKLHVCVDGLVDQLGSQVDRLHNFGPMLTERKIKYGYPVSAMGKKILAEAGINIISCIKCGEAEPALGPRFKKCALCREARYCSAVCQREHWASHRTECSFIQLRSSALSTCGYVACQLCELVEAQNLRTRHRACSRCVGVIYCGKQCQKAAWEIHKSNCKGVKQSKSG